MRISCSLPGRSAVDKQTVNGSEERHRSARNAWELEQPMGQRFAAPSALELLAGDRAPQRVDDSGRLAGDLLDRALQMLGPEPQPCLASDRGVAGHDVHLGVVEERMLVEVGRPNRQPGIVDDPDLRVNVQRAELAQYLEMSIEDVLEGLEAAAAHHSSSLDAPHDDGDGEPGTLADTLGHEDPGLQLVEDATTVATAMQTLAERERRVIQLRFFGDRTQSEIAEQIGVSQMQISRILRRAIATLNERTVPEIPVADDRAPT